MSRSGDHRALPEPCRAAAGAPVTTAPRWGPASQAWGEARDAENQTDTGREGTAHQWGEPSKDLVR